MRLCAHQTALITSDYAAIRLFEHQTARITSGCGPVQDITMKRSTDGGKSPPNPAQTLASPPSLSVCAAALRWPSASSLVMCAWCD